MGLIEEGPPSSLPSGEETAHHCHEKKKKAHGVVKLKGFLRNIRHEFRHGLGIE